MRFEWDPKKNEILKSQRNISFEQVVFHLQQGDIWRVAEHPNQETYPGQRIYFVIIEKYIYMVPHLVKDEEILLKTIIPSRKSTRDYLKEREVNS
jgi:uncharacterized DUF497 family protein